MRIVRRLCVPCTLPELSATLDKPLKLVTAMAHQLKGQGRVRQLDRFVIDGGRRRRLWIATGSADELHEILIHECYDRYAEGEAPWHEVVSLIAARSPGQVARMEHAMGLRS